MLRLLDILQESQLVLHKFIAFSSKRVPFISRVQFIHFGAGHLVATRHLRQRQLRRNQNYSMISAIVMLTAWLAAFINVAAASFRRIAGEFVVVAVEAMFADV